MRSYIKESIMSLLEVHAEVCKHLVLTFSIEVAVVVLPVVVVFVAVAVVVLLSCL